MSPYIKMKKLIWSRGIQYSLLLLASIALITTVACGRSRVVETSQPGSGSQVEYSPGDHAMSMNYDGLERTYIIHIPSGFDASHSVPLVLAFHGLGLDADEMMRITGFNSHSDANGYVVVYPEGTGDTRSWNGGHCCGTAALDKVDDVGFVRALITELSDSLPIDPKQIHATGFSNGSIFTYRLACELPALIASFGPVSATPVDLDLEACAPTRPVPILYFHGTADVANPYYGGETRTGLLLLPVSTTIEFWVNFNGCSAQPQTIESGDIRHDVYSSCESSSAVELYTIENGEHAWPGGEMVNEKMGEPNMEISATALLWEFFRAHPLP